MLKNLQPQILGLIGLSTLLMILARASESHMHLFSFIKLNQTNTLGFIVLASSLSFCINKQLSKDFKNKIVDINYLLRYYLRVFFFILPTYWLVLIIMYFINNYGIQKSGLIDSYEMLFAYMSFAELSHNFYIVPVLLLYLILCPIINFILDKISNWDIVLLLFIILIAVVLVEFINQNIPLEKFNLVKYLSVFLLSSLAAYYANFGAQIKSLTERNKKILNHFASASIILIILSFKSVSEALFRLPSSFALQSFYMYFTILASIIILASLHGEGRLKTIMGSMPLKLLGTISIGIYLIHWPILITLYNSLLFPNEAKVYIYLLLLISFGFLSYFLLILPLLKVLETNKF